MKRAGITVILCITSLFAASAPAAHATVSNGRIYFQRLPDTGSSGVGSVLPDGTDPNVNFTDGGFWESVRMALSPDGTRIALGQYHEGSTSSSARLVTVDAVDGGNLEVVQTPRDSFYDGIAWSPDASMIYFTRSTAHGYRLFSCNADGTGTTRIRSVVHHVFDLTVSPDGTMLGFTDSRERLRVMAASGDDVQILVGKGRTFDPDWSPGGSSIAFSWKRPRADNADIYTIAPDGTARTRLTDSPRRWESWPSWAPDGTMIAFSSARGFRPPDVWRMAADGSGAQNITQTPDSWDISPDWAPA